MAFQQRSQSPAVSEDGFTDTITVKPDNGATTTAASGKTGPAMSGTERRTAANQSRLAKRVPKATVVGAAGMFAKYAPSQSAVRYADNKVGILPDVAAVLQEIADQAGVDLTDGEQSSLFLEALVTDVYVNAYSDKQTFDGVVTVGQFELRRVHIKTVLTKHVGTMYRRFARAMAPLVVQVMHDNPKVFGELLDKRCADLGLSTRAEAVQSFDGADAIITDRTQAQRNAEAKALALRYRHSEHDYSVANSARAGGGIGQSTGIE